MEQAAAERMSQVDDDTAGLSAGWYRHPSRPLEHRFWDGDRWHDQMWPTAVTEATRRTERGGDDQRGARPGRTDEPIAADFWWDPEGDQVTWSPVALTLLGHSDDVAADAGLPWLLDHVAAEDRARVGASFEEHRSPGSGVLHSCHRVLAADGSSQTVLLVASSSGGATLRHGFLVALGPQLVRAADVAVRAAREGSASVQRAVGVLSLLLDLDEDVALALLKRVSSQRNVKLRELAEHLAQAARRHRELVVEDPGTSIGRLLDEAAQVADATRTASDRASSASRRGLT